MTAPSADAVYEEAGRTHLQAGCAPQPRARKPVRLASVCPASSWPRGSLSALLSPCAGLLHRLWPGAGDPFTKLLRPKQAASYSRAASGELTSLGFMVSCGP